ncbi:MAG: hypothetical protein JWR08_881 [Enterovirga sp.]|nr:hypothetical protein [Enterovirga sp.]
MLNPSRNVAAVFGPSEIACLSSAYDAALSSITEAESMASGLTARELRQQIAAGIIAAAKTGQLDPVCLKEAALHALARPCAEID